MDTRFTSESFVGISTGQYHTFGRRSDGTFAAWGFSDYRQCEIPPLPPNLSYVEMIGGYEHSLGRRSDGSVVAWGQNYGCPDVIRRGG